MIGSTEAVLLCASCRCFQTTLLRGLWTSLPPTQFFHMSLRKCILPAVAVFLVTCVYRWKMASALSDWLQVGVTSLRLGKLLQTCSRPSPPHLFCYFWSFISFLSLQLLLLTLMLISLISLFQVQQRGFCQRNTAVSGRNAAGMCSSSMKLGFVAAVIPMQCFEGYEVTCKQAPPQVGL